MAAQNTVNSWFFARFKSAYFKAFLRIGWLRVIFIFFQKKMSKVLCSRKIVVPLHRFRNEAAWIGSSVG
jgi:hypothetical protein